jgi:hypothetical protein
VEQVRRAAQSLAERGFLLREDVERYIEQAQRAGAPRQTLVAELIGVFVR